MLISREFFQFESRYSFYFRNNLKVLKNKFQKNKLQINHKKQFFKLSNRKNIIIWCELFIF
jgi:hypothetical protein